MGALVLLNGHLGYVHTKGFCSHKNGDRARLCRADLESGASHIGKVLCYTLMWTCIRTVAEVNKKERGLEFTEAEVNI